MIKHAIRISSHNKTIPGVISKWIFMLQLFTCIRFEIVIFCGRKANKSSYHIIIIKSISFFPCLLCFCFTSSIILVPLLSSDWVVFIAICDKDSTFLKSVNKNRLPQCTFMCGFEVVGSKSRNEGCQFATDKCASTKKKRWEKKCTFYVGLLLFCYWQSCPI